MSPLETSLRIALSEAGVAHNASMSEIRQTVTQIFESPQWRREALYEAAEQARREIASWPEWVYRSRLTNTPHNSLEGNNNGWP